MAVRPSVLTRIESIVAAEQAADPLLRSFSLHALSSAAIFEHERLSNAPSCVK